MINNRVNNETMSLAPVVGNTLRIGTGFSGLGFRHNQFDGKLDPMIMVDHYTMTSPTFGAHPHAGLSAVSILFEDTQGKFNNRDSLGNDFDIEAGDLYWLNAGSGAIHDEAPRPGASIHGLQVFVNLPAHLKQQAPSSLHIKRENMPTLTGEGYRVRLVLGESNENKAQQESVWPVTILDGYADTRAQFNHQVQTGFNTWVYAVEGDIDVLVNGQTLTLKQGTSMSFTFDEMSLLSIKGTVNSESHFVVMSGQPINEPFVQQGPFAMSSQQEIDAVITRYEAGEFGKLD